MVTATRFSKWPLSRKCVATIETYNNPEVGPPSSPTPLLLVHEFLFKNVAATRRSSINASLVDQNLLRTMEPVEFPELYFLRRVPLSSPTYLQCLRLCYIFSLEMIDDGLFCHWIFARESKKGFVWRTKMNKRVYLYYTYTGCVRKMSKSFWIFFTRYFFALCNFSLNEIQTKNIFIFVIRNSRNLGKFKNLNELWIHFFT